MVANLAATLATSGRSRCAPLSAAHASALCASRSASSRLPSATAILAQVASAIAR
ncbi:Uncharacterised protein [Mycobacterium tuberculosis]|nr:Uncharacterised protein [Mycobacterium tuberculosis]